MNDGNVIRLRYEINSGDFAGAWESCADLKRVLSRAGFSSEVSRRAISALYEGVINIVIHADYGRANVDIEPDKIIIEINDQGPGISELEFAMREGYSRASDSARSLGFGAGSGLPNMRRFADAMELCSAAGAGTRVKMVFDAR